MNEEGEKLSQRKSASEAGCVQYYYVITIVRTISVTVWNKKVTPGLSKIWGIAPSFWQSCQSYVVSLWRGSETDWMIVVVSQRRLHECIQRLPAFSLHRPAWHVPGAKRDSTNLKSESTRPSPLASVKVRERSVPVTSEISAFSASAEVAVATHSSQQALPLPRTERGYANLLFAASCQFCQYNDARRRAQLWQRL